MATLLLALLGCVPQRGGWDIEALVESEPALARIQGHRLGDLVPFPVLDDRRLRLVTCRFATGTAVRVRGGGPAWPAEWAQAAVRAVDGRLAAVSLELDPSHAFVGDDRPLLEVLSIPRTEPPGPRGLGDTQSECDVSAIAGDPGRPRGVLTRAEIRMRRGGRDVVGRFVEAMPEEWVGALMHELGHALGFMGHAATGRSVVVLDQHRLRAIGRDALAGRVESDATLEALYALPPGRELGRAELSIRGALWIEGIRRVHAERLRQGDRWLATLSSVGDEEARLVWRFALAEPLALRFPRWRHDVAKGVPVRAIPDAATRREIVALAPD
ncbi:MAG: hypothetical protein CL908_07930 [Deltaproteobacteria bacterium]|nr:hypothetical protein [Deltaproteobacteria bacterium]